MKTKVTVLLFCFACQISFAQTGTWPVDPGYVYFGANELDQANAGNYSLLQEKSNGRTFLNSPLEIRFRIGNGDHMILSSTGHFGLGTVSPSNWFPGKVFEMADIRPTLKLTSTAPTGLSTIVFTNSGVNSSTHVGEFHLNYQFNQTNNNKSAIRFAGYPAGDILTMHAEGNVGIGTTSPEAKFTISQIGNEWNDGLRINRDASNYLTITEDVTDVRIKNWGAGGILFFTSSTQAATILNNGNLGIGTSLPTAKLDVHQNAGESGQNSGIRVRAGNSQNYFGNTQLSFSYAGGTGYSHAIKTRHNASSVAGNAFDFYVWKPGDAVEAEGTNLVMTLNGSNVGIGTASPNEKLTVNGTIYGKEVKVDLNVPGPDYVFEKNYNLPSLDELKAYIELNKHLPEVPSAKEMEEHGINLGEMNMILLKKVEELTLYVLELKRENGEIKKQLKIKE